MVKPQLGQLEAEQLNTQINLNPDVVIVGAGIAGSALAYVLAEAGLNIVQLEKTLQHKDVVRGEWLAPWGVLEATQLGLTDIYETEGAHRLARHISYSEFLSRDEAEAMTFEMARDFPEVPLCLGHPRTCNLLNSIAVESGVTLCRGITRLQVAPGKPPTVDFEWENLSYSLMPRWVVGADGRNGVVARQIGCVTEHDQEHHLFSGMLVENAYDWPEDLQVIATEGDANVLAFPQGEGRVRIYLGWPKEDRTRLVGPEGPKHFLESWQLECVPHSAVITNATPASPCIAYPNFDAWVDTPVREGVVLIGDAAGRNDPIIGQGLSISHRDVRLVRDAMLGEKDWTTDIFNDYLSERQERMSRLRTVARLTSLKDSAFGETGRKMRHEIHERIAKNPELATPNAAAFIGPEVLPADVFSEAFTRQIVGQPIWSDLP